MAIFTHTAILRFIKRSKSRRFNWNKTATTGYLIQIKFVCAQNVPPIPLFEANQSPEGLARRLENIKGGVGLGWGELPQSGLLTSAIVRVFLSSHNPTSSTANVMSTLAELLVVAGVVT